MEEVFRRVRLRDEAGALARMDTISAAVIVAGTDLEGRTLLHWAAYLNQANVVDRILAMSLKLGNGERRAALNQPATTTRQTALMWSVLGGALHCQCRLMPEADPAQRDSTGSSSLILAIQKGHLESLLLLLCHLDDVSQDSVSENACTTSQSACTMSQSACNKALSVVANCPDNAGCTAAHWAAHTGDAVALRLLRSFGGDMSVVDTAGFMPIHRAAAEGNFEACRALVIEMSQPAGCRSMSKERESPLELLLKQECANPALVSFLRRNAALERREGVGTQTAVRRQLAKLTSMEWGLPVVAGCCFLFLGLHWLMEMRNDLAAIECAAFQSAFLAAAMGFVVLLVTDPGYCARGEPRAVLREVRDRIVTFETGSAESSALGRTCTKCWVIKTDRTQHCRECDTCVRGFDHHCAWLRKCIGQRNRKLFVLWLCGIFVAQVVHLMCGAVLLFRASTSHLGLTKFRTLIESPATTTVVVFHIWSLPCTCPLALFHFLRLIDEERLEWPALSRVVVRISKIMRRATS
eukprot:Polyplicarium_translucidae@DN1543_c0_g1_i1.p1